MRFPLVAALLAAALPVYAQSPAAPAPADLPRAFALALAQSDDIALSEQSLRQAEALYRQALGTLMPELSLRHETNWSPRQTPVSDGMVRLAQTGLNGYRELSALKATRSEEARRRHLRRRAEQLLLGDVAVAFYGLLQARENAASTSGLITFAERRLVELKDRVRVGRAREADAIGQEVQLEALRTQFEESDRQSRARADLLAFLLREDVTPAVPTGPAAPPPPPLDAYLSRLEERPDVAAAREAVAAAAGAASVTRAARLPSLGYQANWYGYRRPVSRERDRWDAGVTASMPLFSWGARAATTDAADAFRSFQEYALRAARRLAELEVRNAHRDLATAERQLEIRRRALALARRDYDLQTRDERRGLVTSLEVLESLNRLNAAELGFQSALLTTRLAVVGLEIAAGADPAAVEPPR